MNVDECDSGDFIKKYVYWMMRAKIHQEIEV